MTADGSRVAIGVLISGRGSNLQALIDAWKSDSLGGDLRVVIANRADAAGLARAAAAGIETLVLPHQEAPSREAYDDQLVAALRERGISLVCLAGFMRRLGAAFCDAFPNAVLNIHPSLLPAFPGTHAHRQALAHGVKVSGATVHLVTPELDAGPILAQGAVVVDDHDTEDSLARRVLEVEHRLYPATVRRVITGKWHLEGRAVVFDA